MGDSSMLAFIDDRMQGWSSPCWASGLLNHFNLVLFSMAERKYFTIIPLDPNLPTELARFQYE